MRLTRSARPVSLALAVCLTAATPGTGAARPRPGVTPHGFRLFARARSALTVNRVFCGLNSTGAICADTAPGYPNGGGFWPKGTADQYVYNSGIQFAGIIGSDGGPWAGDTVGAFFFDASGLHQNAQQVEPVYNASDPADAAPRVWPAEAHVPAGDPSADLYDPLLQGRQTASQGDIWTLAWDGSPANNGGRAHPLGVRVEERGMAWNYPTGNEDILYFIFTFYNVTASDCSVYAGVRPSMQGLLCTLGRAFRDSNEVAVRKSLPPGGYTITDLYVNFSADMDVADAGLNFASVNVPFALGYTYDATFEQYEGWSFDPRIFSPPFFAGSGFAGVKYLSSPRDALGQPVGLTLFGSSDAVGSFPDPLNAAQLYRYISANLNPAAGDPRCNTGDPRVTHICFINNTGPTDMRFFQSSGPQTLPPGGMGSVAVAYLFAAPVVTAGCTPPCRIPPGDPRRLLQPVDLAQGANTIDTMTGYAGFRDVNGNGKVDQEEITTVPGSLLGKALVAQAIFDHGFLLPFAPEAPPFFLIPGDDQVSVLWRPSASEVSGDPYFEVASLPTDATGSSNDLYDPNYRQFDVEGYRVYRGRVDSPNSLQLLAQYDYAGTVIADYAGQVNPTDQCAPELGIRSGCPATTPPGGFDSVGAGLTRTHFVAHELAGDVVQVQLGKRVALANGKVHILEADTAIVGGATNGPCVPSACPPLANTGVPFVYVDRTARNNVRYFYTVTAFDLNSYQSAPSSLESPRITKAVTPAHLAPEYETSGRIIATETVGRGIRMDDRFPQPTLDPATGRFSGPFPVADALHVSFAGEFVSRLLGGTGQFSVTLDSIDPGSAYDAPALPVQYYLTAQSATSSTHLVIPVAPDPQTASATNDGVFPAAAAVDTLARRYGGDSSFALWGQATLTLPGNYYLGDWGRGCINGAPGFTGGGGCDYNGTRWFDGPSPQRNEVSADPTAGNGANSAAPTVNRGLPNNLGFNNAGALTGVAVLHQPLAYQTLPNVYRAIPGVLGSFRRAADYNVYWSAVTPGRIDSVVDVTDNVPLPLDSVPERGMNTGFGVLTQAAAQPVAGSFDNRTELTLADFSCVEPLRHLPAAEAVLPCGSATDPTDGPRYVLGRQAALGPIAFAATSLTDFQTSTNTGTGFGLYLAGNTYLIQTTTLPSGVVWSLRDYAGAISGGHGFAGDEGPYVFFPTTRPFAAQGTTVTVTYQAANIPHPVTTANLRLVHTVPDPYYVTSAYEQATEFKVIKFVNLPERAIIRIYSSSGILVALLEHNSATFGGEEDWNVRNRNNQLVASGVYFYHIEANDNGGTARRIGRMTIINFAD
jgi:hypothetical protein